MDHLLVNEPDPPIVIAPGGFWAIRDRSGVQVMRGLFARFGISNIWNEQYANHLNANNPFTGEQVPEPGRRMYLNLAVGF